MSWHLGGTLRKQNLTLSDVVRLMGKQVLGRFCVYRLSEKPIFIFSTRRSGSTLLMRMIHTQPGIDYVDEPLNLWRLHPHFRVLPHPPSGMFIKLDDSAQQQLHTYLDDLLSGRRRLRHRGNVLDSNRSFLVNRLVVKNINANTLVEWFSKSFDADIIYLVRHPIPAALSAIKRNWGNMAKDYLESEKFPRIHLDSGMVDFGWQTLKHGTQLQRYVLEWCLENLYPLQLSKDQPWLTLSYEELVFRPKEISRLICSRFGLPDSERMYKVVFSPSRTTTQKSKHSITKKGPALWFMNGYRNWIQPDMPVRVRC